MQKKYGRLIIQEELNKYLRSKNFKNANNDKINNHNIKVNNNNNNCNNEMNYPINAMNYLILQSQLFLQQQNIINSVNNFGLLQKNNGICNNENYLGQNKIENDFKKEEKKENFDIKNCDKELIYKIIEIVKKKNRNKQ